jgi:hypothetical protein
MHLAHPALSTTGKKKGKPKFRNADEARKSREREASWKELQKKWALEVDATKRKRGLSAEVWNPPERTYRGANDPKIPSKITSWDPCVMPTPKVYTGNMVKGIATMHKSNAVPVFSNQEAVEISNMRR